MALLAKRNKLQINNCGTTAATLIDDLRGFSLIEVLVALIILSISLLALASVIVTSIQVNQQNDYRNTAVRLTSETTENLLAQSIDSLSDGTANSTVSVKIRGVSLPYTVSTNISTLTNDLKQINITVQYTFKGQPHTNNSIIYKHRAI